MQLCVFEKLSLSPKLWEAQFSNYRAGQARTSYLYHKIDSAEVFSDANHCLGRRMPAFRLPEHLNILLDIRMVELNP